MLDELRNKLETEVDALAHELNVVLPLEIEKAVAQGDLRENSEYTAALERQRFVQARIGYIARRLSKMADIKVEHVPTDRVGFGSHVTVKDASDGETARYVLTLGDNIDVDSDEISMESPLGKALVGREPGDTVTVLLPGGTVELEILELQTIHERGGVLG